MLDGMRLEFASIIMELNYGSLGEHNVSVKRYDGGIGRHYDRDIIDVDIFMSIKLPEVQDSFMGGE